ncbi:MAG: HEAT repeat domain-containing protein [Parvibaculaceae bacterium]
MKYAKWKTLMKSDKAADRSHAADQLPVGGPKSHIVRMLIAALDDADYLVRTCAADTLGVISSKSVRLALRRRLKIETHTLVRRYLLSSLGDIGTLSDARIILPRLEKAKNYGIRIHAAQGLGKIAVREWVEYTTALCRSRNWRKRELGLTQLEQTVFYFRNIIVDAKWLVRRWRWESLNPTEKEMVKAILDVKVT